MLIEQGVNIHVVQKVLGHTRVTTTERYTHVAAAQVQDAGNRMAAALWGEDQLQRKRQLRPLAPGNDQGPSRDFPREALISGRRLGDLNPGWTVSPNRISSSSNDLPPITAKVR
jgi:hypothetical protein